MKYVIVDLYSDEPAGLGVPPYLGTYPRYIAGRIWTLDEGAEITYLTVDDVRLCYKYKYELPKVKPSGHTLIDVYNVTLNSDKVHDALMSADEVIVVGGAHTPGKYLSAVPGTLGELKRLIPKPRRVVLTGPMASEFGSSFMGGSKVHKITDEYFDLIDENYLNHLNFDMIEEVSVAGARIVEQVGFPVIAEIETSRGCPRMPGCSFCTEPYKWNNEFREQENIINEVKALMDRGVKYIRLGKQSCFYSYKLGKPSEIKELLEGVAGLGPEVLHIDNANPTMVVSDAGIEVTKLIVKYCTEGNVAAFGVESFDPRVVTENNLNSDPETSLKAIRIINKYGSERGRNGMPKFLPGVNILLGLKGENRNTFALNLEALHTVLDEGMMLRRINIRKVVVFAGTDLGETVNNKFVKKNQRFYFGFRKRVREEIDFEMLKRVAPIGHVFRDVYTQVHDGKTTFARQFGTYPLIIGVKKWLELKRFINVKVKGHMLRSIMGEVYE